MACGGSEHASAPSVSRSAPAEVATAPIPARPTSLPATPPPKVTVDYRIRTRDGDDHVLKLTDQGARYGLVHAKARVALRFGLEAGALHAVYDTLRMQSFDRIESIEAPTPPARGTSIQLTAGAGRHGASHMGRSMPAAEWADGYARSLASVDALVPAGRSEVVVHIRWDDSMAERAAALDIELGQDLVGVHRQPGTLPNVDLHIAAPRPLAALIRHGSPATSSRHQIEAGAQWGAEVAYDADLDAVVLRPLSAPAG